MKIKSNFELVSVGDESMLVPVGDEARRFKGLLVMNEESAMMIRMMQTNQTVNSLMAALLSEYDIEPEVAQRDLDALLHKLDDMGILETTSAC